jgi:dihydrofolate synthase/folylpolyglutamate synthase
MDELLARLGNPHLKATSVHIAGTKGKGSTAVMIASVLTAAGYKTGLYTSPHLIDLRERIRIDGELISKSSFVETVARLKPEVEAVNLKAAYGMLTTFELLTALGFLYFGSSGVDFQVVEAGLGGRLDATNVIRPIVSVITSISLDHTEVLGNSLFKIASEKAGIIKPGSVVISAPQVEEAARVIEAVCLERGARLIRAGSDVTWEWLGFLEGKQMLDIRGRLDTYRLALPLLGHYQLENAAVAVAALEVLSEKGFSVSREKIVAGLGRVSWPGRFQVLGCSPLILVDGAHNPLSARELARSLEHYFKSCYRKKPFREAVLVFGTSRDKDIAGIVPELCPLFHRVIVTRSRHPRAMAIPPITAEFQKYGVEAVSAETVAEAISIACEMAGKQGFICITGSLFIVGEAIEYIAGSC